MESIARPAMESILAVALSSDFSREDSLGFPSAGMLRLLQLFDQK